MRLETETRVQGVMLLASFIASIGFVGTGVLILAGIIQYSMPLLFTVGGLFIIMSVTILVGARWTQKTMDRCKKIREGGGDEADLEWLKTRKSSSFTKVNKDK